MYIYLMIWSKYIKEYIEYLHIERGLSFNTMFSYRIDLKLLHKWIVNNNIDVTPLDITVQILQDFLYSRSKSVKPSTLNRCLASLRGFFIYLHFQEYRKDNPMDLIDSPKTSRSLPDILSIEEIDKIIHQIDLSNPQGERNRGILEMLYGCGLRVSEVINLRISDLFFDEGFIRVRGKGNQQRLVPIAPITIKYINIYRTEIRNHQKVDTKSSDILFLNRRGKALTRNMVFIIVQDLAEKAGIKKKVSLHIFGLSLAIHFLENGRDLGAFQHIRGHKNIPTTEIYTPLNINI